MGESDADKLSRVRMMASGSETWDLSSNDIAALKYVLTALAAANEALTAARALLREALPWLDTEFFEEDRELHGRVVAYLEGR